MSSSNLDPDQKQMCIRDSDPFQQVSFFVPRVPFAHRSVSAHLANIKQTVAPMKPHQKTDQDESHEAGYGNRRLTAAHLYSIQL